MGSPGDSPSVSTTWRNRPNVQRVQMQPLRTLGLATLGQAPAKGDEVDVLEGAALPCGTPDQETSSIGCLNHAESCASVVQISRHFSPMQTTTVSLRACPPSRLQ